MRSRSMHCIHPSSEQDGITQDDIQRFEKIAAALVAKMSDLPEDEQESGMQHPHLPPFTWVLQYHSYVSALF